MPAPYSQDLRERVIGFMALGGSARAAATRFEVSVSSTTRRAQRWRAEGHVRPCAMGGDRRSRLSEHGTTVLQLNSVQFGTCSFLVWPQAMRLHMGTFP